MYAGVGWESIKEKYESICETSVSNLPKEIGSEECAHSTDFFTRERVTSKIKQIVQNIKNLWMQGGKVEDVE